MLYELSYANMIMYSAVIPRYRGRKDKQKVEEEVLNGDDPKNRDRINALFDEEA